jgi:hypothetical protein
MGRKQVCCFLSRIGNDKRRWMCVDVDLTLTLTGCMCIPPKSRGEREKLASALIVALQRSTNEATSSYSACSRCQDELEGIHEQIWCVLVQRPMISQKLSITAIQSATPKPTIKPSHCGILHSSPSAPNILKHSSLLNICAACTALGWPAWTSALPSSTNTFTTSS